MPRAFRLPSLIALLLATGSVAVAQQPHWIWTAATDDPIDFETEFEVHSHLTSAEVLVAGRSAHANVFIDEQRIVECDAYSPLCRSDVTAYLRAGQHRLTMVGVPCAGPSAFFAVLRLRYADGSQDDVVTNDSWSCRAGGKPHPVQVLAPVDHRLLTPHERRVSVDATDNYQQWKHAIDAKQGSDPATFRVTPGFEIERVRSAQDDEDSWVCLAFDPQGRAVIAMEQQGLLRMTLSPDGKAVRRVERFAESLKECRGLAFADNSLYANANNSKALYRLRGDKGEMSSLLFTTSGGAGHGRNSLTVGPDGKIYSIHGDSVGLLSQATDLTSPFRDARQGKKTSEGHVIRMDPKTLKIETVTAGLRNPFGIAFNADGEMFTYDADAEFDMGSPWYRPTRVSHLVVGGDYGWRGVTGSWPPYYPDHPDTALPNIDIGKGSPTAVKFGTASNFPDAYRQALFVLDWTYGRILLVHALPRGASYLCAAETFLQGKPLNVTGLDFAPDGSLYVVTGGRKTQSALYRIRYVGEKPESTTEANDFEQRSREFAKASRALRHELEAHLGKTLDTQTLDSVWQQLGNPDPWIRYAARNVIEQQPLTMWQQRALTENDRRKALGALMSLARGKQAQLAPEILTRLGAIDMSNATQSERLTAAYTHVLCLTSAGRLDASVTQSVQDRLLTRYPDSDYLVNQRLSEALAKLNTAAMVPKTIQLLKSTTEQHEQMHYLFVLRHMRQGWTPSLREIYFDALVQSEHYLGGQGMPGFRDKIREEALASLSDVERKRYEPMLASAASSDDTTLPSRPMVRKWTLADVLVELKKRAGTANLQRGEKLFAAASCSKCHRVGGRGTLVGPDLTGASRRYTQRDLLDSIVNPSKVIAENYRSLQIVTTDGKNYVGRPALGGDYRSPVLRLTTDPARPFHVTEIPKTDIEVQRTSPISWMPQGLLDTLNAEEIRDLLAYIEARGVVQ